MAGSSSNALDAILTLIREDMNNTGDDIITGACPSFENYQYRVGIIAGLAISERHILDIKQKVEDA